jgi:hypothetical protein
MKAPDDEIARLATGNLVEVELWQQQLKEAGIESRVVGEDLTSSFGSALSGAIELWVHRDDFARAEEVLEEAEKQPESES